MQSQLSQVLHILESTKYLIHQQVRQKIALFHQSLVELVEINFRECRIKVSESIKQKEDFPKKLEEEILQKFNQFHESSLSLRRNQSNFELGLSLLQQNNRTDLISVVVEPRINDYNNKEIIDPSKLSQSKDSQTHPHLDVKEKKDTSNLNQKHILNAFNSSENHPQNFKYQSYHQIIDPNLSNQHRQTVKEFIMHSQIGIQEDIVREQFKQQVEKVEVPCQVEGNSSSSPSKSSIGMNVSPTNSRDNTAFGKECSKYEKKMIIKGKQQSDVLNEISLIKTKYPIIDQSKSIQKSNLDQLDMILDSISTIDDSTKISEEQLYRKHQAFATLREWPSTYMWVIHLSQKKYQLNFNFYDYKKGQYGNFNDQLNRLLQKYSENENLFRMFFQVIRIILTKKMHLSLRNNLMEVKWSSLEQLIIYDDNNWCGWLEDFSFLNPVFQSNGYNLKIVEFHLDFLFPKYIEFLSKFSFTFKVEIYVKHMTQETYLMLKNTQFIKPDKINILFKLNLVQIQQVMKLENYNEQQNINVKIIQSIDLKLVYFFNVLMPLDMNTFYDKCVYIKKEYLLSLSISQDLVDEWYVQSQKRSIQNNLKSIYMLNQDGGFDFSIQKKMQLQFLFSKFEWNEVQCLTINNNLSYNAWTLFHQNSQNFSNLNRIHLQYAYFQLQLVEAEHLAKFKRLESLIIALEILYKQRYASEQQDLKDQMEERQCVWVKKFNFRRLKLLYELSIKLPHLQVIFRPEFYSSKSQIQIQETQIKKLFDSSEEVKNFQTWLTINIKENLGKQVKIILDNLLEPQSSLT